MGADEGGLALQAKATIAVIFGGRSGEHVVSLRSAASIMEAIDRDQYAVLPVGITREGSWIAGEDAWQALWDLSDPIKAAPALMSTDPARPGFFIQAGSAPDHWRYHPVDLVFPVLHGPYGEDGSIQGLFELSGIPYVGSGVTASAVGMDKVLMKTLFQRQGLPVAPFCHFTMHRWIDSKLETRHSTIEKLGLPLFVKPANLGSSVGISKVRSDQEFDKAVDEALLYDDKVIAEAFVEGREIEVSVLGDLEVEASRPGEIIPCNEFYDYRAKYIDDRSELIVPVELGEELESRLRDYACRAFLGIEASGLARVDFFLPAQSNEPIVNEINTMPGFTNISMFPKLWAVSGISYGELIDRLLNYAKARFKRRRRLLAQPPE